MTQRRNGKYPFSSSCWIAFLILIPIGCRVRPKAYDPPPERHLLEDRWSGYSFDRVHAEFYVPLYTPAPELLRDFSDPIEVVSSSGEVRASLSSAAGTAPEGAMVTIDYAAESEGGGAGEVSVELRWPNPGQSMSRSQKVISETRTVEFSYDQLRWFLIRSGRFQVDGDDPYYRTKNADGGFSSDESVHRADIKIDGQNRESDFDRRVSYERPSELYKIVKEVWPGAQ